MIQLYNTLTRKKEPFEPLVPGKVGMYTCGPTIYDRKHIGNFRTYTTSDLLVRTLTYFGYDVSHIMNFTDVGHLTGDNEGDADTGEDRLVKAAKRERKTAWDVAKMYEEMFRDDFAKMGLLQPARYVRATDHIQEQIDMIKVLEAKGFAYVTSDGVYFDTKSYEEKTGSRYGELSTLDEIKEGARVEANPEKWNPRDFALWKKSPAGEKRDMEWESPWGIGFPGWHIECSAMSVKYLGETFDIHVGGEDLRSTHHPNEIAQSQGATGKLFVRYWVHSSFVLIDGGRMSTSQGNNYKVGDIIDKGFDPLALRYLYMTTHYKKQLNFTWDSLTATQTALDKLREQMAEYRTSAQEAIQLSDAARGFEEKFRQAISDELNFPQALSIVWEVVKSDLSDQEKYSLLLAWDAVLGLGLDTYISKPLEIPAEILALVEARQLARSEKRFPDADRLRKEIEEKGFVLEDTSSGPVVRMGK